HLALTNDGVEIGVERFDLARDLRADLNRHYGVEVASRRDCRDEGPALGPLEPVNGGARLVLRVEVPPDSGSDCDANEEKRQRPLDQPFATRSVIAHALHPST